MNTPLLKKTDIYSSLGFDGTSKIEAYRITKLQHVTAIQNRYLENPPSEGKKIPLALDLEDNDLNNSSSILNKLIELKKSDKSLEILSIVADQQKPDITDLSSFVQYNLHKLCELSPEVKHLKLPNLINFFSFPLPQNLSSLQIKPINYQHWELPSKIQNIDITSLPQNSLVDFTKVEGLKHAFISQMHGKIEGKIKLPIWSSKRTWDAYHELITKSNILSKSKLIRDFTFSLFLNLILTLIHRSITYFLLVALLIPYLLFLKRHF